MAKVEVLSTGDDPSVDEVETVNDPADDESQPVTDAPVGDDPPAAAAAEPAEDEVTITIGDEPAPVDEEARAPDWVRELRKSHRELQRKNRELEQRLQGTPAATPQLGKKPSLDDFDYDAEKYETALESWYDTKRKVEAVAAEADKAKERVAAEWQAKLDTYAQHKAALQVTGYGDAEARVEEALNGDQQAVLIKALDNPATVVYALGRDAARLKDLAAITDPILFAAAISKLEGKLKVTTRNAPPPPEKTVKGSAPISGTVDSTLDRLRDEAAKTGNYTKVLAYRNQKR
jgi:hypothetical protein